MNLTNILHSFGKLFTIQSFLPNSCLQVRLIRLVRTCQPPAMCRHLPKFLQQELLASYTVVELHNFVYVHLFSIGMVLHH